MLEQVLTDIHTADPEWNVILLRYFNPIGAHKSGMIGEDPKGSSRTTCFRMSALHPVASAKSWKLPRVFPFTTSEPAKAFGDDYTGRNWCATKRLHPCADS